MEESHINVRLEFRGIETWDTDDQGPKANGPDSMAGKANGPDSMACKDVVSCAWHRNSSRIYLYGIKALIFLRNKYFTKGHLESQQAQWDSEIA